MDYKVVKNNNKKYIECISNNKELCSEQNISDVISICFQYDINKLILHSKILSEDFFNLKTGLAGIMLQKFINYHIKVALILNDEIILNERFKEMIMESNKGNSFRTFNNIKDGEKWILSL